MDTETPIQAPVSAPAAPMTLQQQADKLPKLPAGKSYVKFLKNVGEHLTGEIVAFDDAAAKAICTPSVSMDGTTKIHHTKAILLNDALQMASVPADPKKMTQYDLKKLGQKNIVVTPPDAVFEANLTKIKNGLEVPADKLGKVAGSNKGTSSDPEWVDRTKAPLAKK